MKKTSMASFIVAIILVASSIALFVLGFLSVNTTQVYSKVGNGYSFMQISYSLSLNSIIHGLFFVLLGGFLFIGGILMFILSAVVRPHNSNCMKSKKANNYAMCTSAATPEQSQIQNSQESVNVVNNTEPPTVESSCTAPSNPESAK